MRDCLNCSTKACRSLGADCFHLRQGSLDAYESDDAQRIIRSAGSLVENGRAGVLSRFEELIEFIKSQNYANVGLAYCFGIETVAGRVSKLIAAKTGATVVPARCSMGGIRECEIDKRTSSTSIGCNPAGQARFLNARTDFVVEMGLCLGHDVIFHTELQKPFTVLLVKDRVHRHNPLNGIEASALKPCTGE